MPHDPKTTPTDLAKTPDGGIAITWADGKTTRYAVDWLRSKCPCAGCVDEWTGEVRVTLSQVRGTGFKSVTPVGAYAFQIRFDDGHETGIYTFQRLRQLGDELAGESA